MAVSIYQQTPEFKGNRTEMKDISSRKTTYLRPNQGFDWGRLLEVWEFRELFLVLAWRDVAIRYKQTLIGFAWVILQPVVIMLIFSVIFGRVAKMPSDGIPYPVFAFTAILPWQMFARGLSDGSMSLVSNYQIITKVYFPRILIPASVILTAFVDFLVAFGVLLGLMAWYGIVPGIAILAIPGFLLLALSIAFGVALWFSVINTKYRDVRLALPFLTQIWMYLTPVVYPSSMIPEPWRLVYGLNPMVSVVEGFRWALLGIDKSPDPIMMGASISTALPLIVGGIWYFGKQERLAADII